MNNKIMSQFIVEKKQDYLFKLEQSISTLFYQGFKAIYSFTLQQNKISKNLLKEFQANLKDISTWTKEDIETEYTRFKNIDKLILSLLKINLAILNPHKTDFKYPSASEYIYQCNLNIARNIWKNPFLFYEKNLSKSEIQQNYNKILKMIKKSINETFIQMIPTDDEEEESTKEIIKDVQKEEDEKKDEDEDEDEEENDGSGDDEDEEESDEDSDEDEDDDGDEEEEDSDEDSNEDEDDDVDDEDEEDSDENSDEDEDDDGDDEEEEDSEEDLEDSDEDEEEEEDECEDENGDNNEESNDDKDESDDQDSEESEEEEESEPEPESNVKVITLLEKKNLIKEKLKNNMGKKYDSFF